MKIRMIKTTLGSVDGINVKVYEADVEYDLSSSPGAVDLANALVGARLAVEVETDANPVVAVPKEVDAPAPAESVEPPADPEPKPRGRRKA